MRLLLDTHILLWSLADSPRLSAPARALLADTANECWVSAASLWEIAIKVMLGKYRLRFALTELEGAVEESGYRALDVSARHALAIERIRIPHADPFDRLLLAQCEIETFRLLSADRLLATLPTVLRAD